MKPLSLRFRPKYRAGGDELCRAAEELYKCGHHLQCLALLQRAKDCYVRAHLVIRAAKTLELGLTIAIQHCYKDINRSEVRTRGSRQKGTVKIRLVHKFILKNISRRA